MGLHIWQLPYSRAGFVRVNLTAAAADLSADLSGDVSGDLSGDGGGDLSGNVRDVVSGEVGGVPGPSAVSA